MIYFVTVALNRKTGWKFSKQEQNCIEKEKSYKNASGYYHQKANLGKSRDVLLLSFDFMSRRAICLKGDLKETEIMLKQEIVDSIEDSYGKIIQLREWYPQIV